MMNSSKKMMSFSTILGRSALGAFGGAVIGYIAGVAYYFIVSVPRAEGMHPMHRDSFLCAEGQAPLMFAIFGIILGIGIAFVRRRSEPNENASL